MSWKAGLAPDSSAWRATVAYAHERIADLTGMCTAVESSDSAIRQAQAGILELQRLIALPMVLRNEAQARGAMGSRKEY